MDIHNFMLATSLWNLYASGVKPVLDVRHEKGIDSAKNGLLHLYHGKIIISKDSLLDDFPTSAFGVAEFQKIIYHDFDRFASEKNLQIDLELNDSELVVYYYITETL